MFGFRPAFAIRSKTFASDHRTYMIVDDATGTSPSTETDAVAPAAKPPPTRRLTPPQGAVEPSKTPVEPPNPPHRESGSCSVFAPSSLCRRFPTTRLPAGGDPHWPKSSRPVGLDGSSCVPTVRQLSLRPRRRYGGRRSRGCGILCLINGMTESVRDQMAFPTMTNRVRVSGTRA